MKRMIAAIAAVGALAGCSSGTGASPSPNAGGVLAPATPDKSLDMCATLPTTQVTELVGVKINDAKPTDGGGSGCAYAGTEQRGEFKIEVRYHVDGWVNTDTGAEPVSGVGEKAHYDPDVGLAVKTGVRGLLVVHIPASLVSGVKDKSVQVAKAVLGKL